MTPDRERAREAAIEAAFQANDHRELSYMTETLIYAAVDALLALPDPVRGAAREVVERWDRWQLESGPGLRVNTAVGRHRTREAIDRLRAALVEESEQK